MTLSQAQIAARDGRLTASCVACLMTGDEVKILNLWRELVGDPNYTPENLDDVWPVQLGVVTEALNLRWYEKKHGTLSRCGEVVIHPRHDWAACTLDAWCDTHQCPVEAKHVGGREPLAKVIDRYQPQLHWQMFVTGARRSVLSVIEGANEPVCETVVYDDAYGEELFRRARAFMECVWSLTPPVAMPEQAAPVRPVKEYDFHGANEWASYAVQWLENIAGKKAADTAEKALKALVPADGVRCFGHGVAITRDRAGRLSLKEHQS